MKKLKHEMKLGQLAGEIKERDHNLMCASIPLAVTFLAYTICVLYYGIECGENSFSPCGLLVGIAQFLQHKFYWCLRSMSCFFLWLFNCKDCHKTIKKSGTGMLQMPKLKVRKVPKIDVPKVPKIEIPNLSKLAPNLGSIERDQSKEKVLLALLGILLLSFLLYLLSRWLIGKMRNWRLNKTILQINDEGKWEYGPSAKKLKLK